MNRSFTAEEWTNLIPKKEWYDAVNEANDLIQDDVEVDIQGYDIDPDVVRAARKNAEDAGVDHMIHFSREPCRICAIRRNTVLSSQIRRMESVLRRKRNFRSYTLILEKFPYSGFMVSVYDHKL